MGEEDSPEQKILRADLLGLLAKKDDIAEAQRRFREIFWENKTAPASLRGRIIALGGKFGGREEFDKLKEVLLSTDDADYKRELVCGIAMNKVPELHQELLEFMLTDEVRK